MDAFHLNAVKSYHYEAGDGEHLLRFNTYIRPDILTILVEHTRRLVLVVSGCKHLDACHRIQATSLARPEEELCWKWGGVMAKAEMWTKRERWRKS